MLEPSLLCQVLDCLGFDDRQRVEGASTDCRDAVRTTLQNLRVLANFTLPHPKKASFRWIAPRCNGLQMLQLCNASWLTDESLGLIAKAAPPLNYLGLRECKNITDVGVKAAVVSMASTLEVLDLVFASRTTYSSAIMAHRVAAAAERSEHIKQLCVLRLPNYLVGNFETPWGEMHTYYPDGSLDLGRNEESVGWVADLASSLDKASLYDRIQFIDAHHTPWPTTTDVVAQKVAEHLLEQRTGVLVSTRRDYGLVVVQSLSRPAPPEKYTQTMKAVAASLGRGQMMEVSDPDLGLVVVSRMRHTMLSSGILAPPPEMLARLADFVEKHPLVMQPSPQ